MNAQPRILVMGAGGIGGIVASTLMEIGSAVTAVSTNALIRAAVDKSGFRVVDDGEERTVRGWVSPAPEGKYDLCILATQPPNVLKADVRQGGSHGSPERGGLRVMRADAQTLVPIGVGQRAAHRLQAFGPVRTDEQRFVDVRFA